MTFSERELGELEQRIKHLEHHRRNQRMILHGLEERLNALKADTDRLRARIFSTISSVAVFAALVAWLIEFIAA